MTDDTTDSTAAGEPAAEPNANQRELSQMSALVQRAALSAALGQSWGDVSDRDYFDTLGYPSQAELNVNDFWARYERGGIAETIVSAPAGQTWNDVPEVEDTPDEPEADDESSDFENDVAALFDEHGLLNTLDRADTLQRIGRYGVIVVGFNDGGDLSDPVNRERLSGSVEDDILYFQPFGEKDIQELERVEDPQDERFTKPKEYDIDFGEEGIGNETVHHERVIHLAEGALEDDVVGRSALRPIFNYLIDLTKVVGGSAEMYWRDAKKRFIAELPDGGAAGVDEEELQNQIVEMVNDMRDVVYATGGLEMNAVEGGSPDPSGIKDGILELIAGQTRIPKRRLLGTERGDLASTQDEAAFVSMVEERRRKFAEPEVFRDLVDWLVELNIVDPPAGGDYDVIWPDLFELTELEEAEMRQRLAKAYKDVAAMGDPSEVATTEERREEVLDLPPERGAASSGPSGTGPPTDPETPEEDTDVDVDPGVPDPEADDVLDESDPEVEDWFQEEFGEPADQLEADGGEVTDE